jgi:DNA-binding NarL/FixJ family response regulator
MGQPCYSWLKQFTSKSPIKVGICSDLPNIREMLECVQSGAKAYCNSYMASVHFYQMIQLLDDGQSWFPPQMLEQTFKLAHKAANPAIFNNSLEHLTAREKEIALAVAAGKSNIQIASQFKIAEQTVKTHLTNIFKKLELKDRVALVLYLKAS